MKLHTSPLHESVKTSKQFSASSHRLLAVFLCREMQLVRFHRRRYTRVPLNAEPVYTTPYPVLGAEKLRKREQPRQMAMPYRTHGVRFL